MSPSCVDEADAFGRERDVILESRQRTEMRDEEAITLEVDESWGQWHCICFGLLLGLTLSCFWELLTECREFSSFSRIKSPDASTLADVKAVVDVSHRSRQKPRNSPIR